MSNDPKIIREARRLAKEQARSSRRPYSHHLDDISRKAGHGTWSSYVHAQRHGNSGFLKVQEIADRFSIDRRNLSSAMRQKGLICVTRNYPTISCKFLSGSTHLKTQGRAPPNHEYDWY